MLQCALVEWSPKWTHGRHEKCKKQENNVSRSPVDMPINTTTCTTKRIRWSTQFMLYHRPVSFILRWSERFTNAVNVNNSRKIPISNFSGRGKNKSLFGCQAAQQSPRRQIELLVEINTIFSIILEFFLNYSKVNKNMSLFHKSSQE